MRRAFIMMIAALSFAIALSADAQILPQMFFAKPTTVAPVCGTLNFNLSQSCLITLTLGIP